MARPSRPATPRRLFGLSEWVWLTAAAAAVAAHAALWLQGSL